jgi:hypothetical protein
MNFFGESPGPIRNVTVASGDLFEQDVSRSAFPTSKGSYAKLGSSFRRFLGCSDSVAIVVL